MGLSLRRRQHHSRRSGFDPGQPANFPSFHHPTHPPRRAGSCLAGDVTGKYQTAPACASRAASPLLLPINTGRAPSSTRFCQKDPLGFPRPPAHFAGRHRPLSLFLYLVAAAAASPAPVLNPGRGWRAFLWPSRRWRRHFGAAGDGR